MSTDAVGAQNGTEKVCFFTSTCRIISFPEELTFNLRPLEYLGLASKVEAKKN